MNTPGCCSLQDAQWSLFFTTAGPEQCVQSASPTQHSAGKMRGETMRGRNMIWDADWDRQMIICKTTPGVMCLISSICPAALVVSLPGGGSSAGQFHRGPAAGPERALLLLHVFIAADLAAQLADWTGEAAQPGEAAAGAGIPAEAAGSSCWGEEEEGEGVGAEGTAADWKGGAAPCTGNYASFSTSSVLGSCKS